MQPKQELVRGLLANITQRVQRCPWGGITALCQSSEIYSFERDSMLQPEEYLHLQGYPKNRVLPVGVLPAYAGRLSGEGFALPCIATAIYAIYLSTEGVWWRE